MADEYGSCRSISSGMAYVCKPGDLPQCRAQCDKGNPQNCAMLGYMFEKGEGTKEDLAAAQSAYQKACDKRDPDGCMGLGYLMSKSKDPARIAKSTEIFRLACDRGNGRACSGLGQQARLRRDLGLSALTAECKQSRDESCEVLVDYFNGRYGKAAPLGDKAVENYDKACSRGQEDACFEIALIYEGGLGGIKRDAAKAKDDYGLACSKGYDDACKKAGRAPSGAVGAETKPYCNAKGQPIKSLKPSQHCP